jgi:hypothetical protein
MQQEKQLQKKSLNRDTGEYVEFSKPSISLGIEPSVLHVTLRGEFAWWEAGMAVTEVGFAVCMRRNHILRHECLALTPAPIALED